MLFQNEGVTSVSIAGEQKAAHAAPGFDGLYRADGAHPEQTLGNDLAGTGD
ncbi:hypothetical protein D3C76_1797940 [compost metagenome]